MRELWAASMRDTGNRNTHKTATTRHDRSHDLAQPDVEDEGLPAIPGGIKLAAIREGACRAGMAGGAVRS